MNLAQFVNCNFKILGRRLYSPSVKEVAWLEDASVKISNFPFIFLAKYEKLKVNWSWTSSNPVTTAFKYVEYNVLTSLVLRFKSWAKFNTFFFKKKKTLFAIRLPYKLPQDSTSMTIWRHYSGSFMDCPLNVVLLLNYFQ